MNKPLSLNTVRELGASEKHTDWNAGGRVHNWRSHVPDEIQDVWDELSDEARGIVLIMAEELASAEEWE